MKNIHVLPTDKPSRLFEIIQFNLSFDNQNMYSEEYKKLHSYKNKNIYITSDEDIKDVRPHKGKWQLEQGHILNKFPTYLTDLSECKLVIMTTDQDLIKDGVQAIDDEFLEWFVKNPSCEELKIGIEIWNDGTFSYRIIIPKEEPKQGTISEAIKQVITNQLEQKIINGAIGKNGISDTGLGEIRLDIPKQETLEEFANKTYPFYGDVELREAIELGAKWQQEQNKKCYHPLPYRLAKSDVNYECTLCGKFI